MHLEQIPLAPMRWELISISVEGLEHVEDVADRLLGEAGEFARRIGQEVHAPRALGLRRSADRDECLP